MVEFLTHMVQTVGWLRMLLVWIGLLGMPLCAVAEQNPGTPTIGEVWLSNPTAAAPFMHAFRAGLADLGYVEGRTVNIISRFGGGDATKLPGLISELLTRKVDILYVTPKGLPGAMRATETIPIVAMGFADPITEGFTTSLARPGRNVTGMSWQSRDTAGKRLELAQQLVPLRRVAVLFDPADQRSVAATAFHSLANNAGIRARSFELTAPEEHQAVLSGIAKFQPDIMLLGVSPLMYMLRDSILRFAITHRIPIISEGRVMAQAGALLTYGPDELAMTRRSAFYVDRILRGAKPADLPIEQPTKWEVIVNLKTAKAIGLTVPDSILARADEVLQ